MPSESYRYDGLLLFADEDSRFVKYTIYQPLIKEGYKILWKHDPTSNAFAPGKSVIQSMQCAVEVCRIVVLICTKHSGTEFDQEVAYCIDIQNSQGMRRMLPVTIEDECQLASQLKRYTQVRIKTRNLSRTEHINLVSRLKKDLGKLILHCQIKPSSCVIIHEHAYIQGDLFSHDTLKFTILRNYTGSECHGTAISLYHIILWRVLATILWDINWKDIVMTYQWIYFQSGLYSLNQVACALRNFFMVYKLYMHMQYH